ncbi:aldo/keto reductase [Limosilactobacillus kribbianus]|uniref:aldo/keto reductase n=1 Tax=Limosilactobacillus kribbianus TaxID=2982695 RepID=UPI0022642ADE|nr:aldo/keto reductase [Limosilactobacillus kribbianus]
MKTIELANGVKMPMTGFGVYRIKPGEDTKQAVLDALKNGYRAIDTAAAYMNEGDVAAAIKESGVPRDQVFVTSKLWLQDYGEEAAQKEINRVLAATGLDYFDLYLLHQPLADYYGTWRGLEQAYRDGKLKAIGVANFTPGVVLDLMMNNEIAPMVDQIELHPYYQQAENVKWLQDHQIVVESWGPFVNGQGGIFTNPVLTKIAAAHDKTVAQIILAWLLQRNIVIIPKSVHEARMQQNLGSEDIQLTADEMKAIAGLDQGHSAFDWNIMDNFNNPAMIKVLNDARVHD